MGRKAVCLQSASGIETEPAEPEHGSSQNHKRDIMYTVSRKFIALPSSQNNGKGQGADSRTDMHHVASGEVHRSDGGKESSLSPDHMRQGIIHDQRPERHKEKQGLKLHSPYQCSCNERRRDHGEHHLKGAEHQMRDRRGVCARLHSHSAKSEPSEISDDSSIIPAKGKGITEQRPHHH